MTWNPMQCRTCKTDYALTSETMNFLRASGHTFHCPFGHQWVFTDEPSEADLLRRERDRLKQENARLEEMKLAAERAERAAHEHAMAQTRKASAARGQVTRLKNRAANGVCPCCNRTFANLQRHMATKHSGFTAEEVPAEAALH